MWVRMVWITAAMEAIILVAAYKVYSYSNALSVIYICSGFLLLGLLLRVRKTKQYYVLSNVATAVFLFDTVVALIR